MSTEQTFTDNAAPDVTGVPIDPNVTTEPQPTRGSDLDAAIDKAFEKAGLKERKAAAKAKNAPDDPDGTDGTETAKQKRDSKSGKQGKEIDDALKTAEAKAGVKAKDGKAEGGSRLPHDDPPPRFNEHAKGEWASLPEQSRAEVHRMQRELESGISHYRERYEPVRDFDELAKSHGTNLRQALTKYVTLEIALTGDDPMWKLSAIEHLFAHSGVPLEQFCRAYLNLKPEDHMQRQQASTQQRVQQLEQMISQQHAVNQHQHQFAQTLGYLKGFAAEHPDFDELVDDIEAGVKGGVSLAEAYQNARRRKNAGTKSISGGPSSDRDLSPHKKGKSKSIDDALDSAMARVGVR